MKKMVFLFLFFYGMGSSFFVSRCHAFEELSHVQDTGKELCDFAGELLDFLDDEDQAFLQRLHELNGEASPYMQPIIGDLIVVFEKDGKDGLVSDIGRRIKFAAEKEHFVRSDLRGITKKFEGTFATQKDSRGRNQMPRESDYHKGMIDARVEKDYKKALYFYLKISESKCCSSAPSQK